MAICEGLTMAIANPSQELLMNAAFASDMLLHRPDSDIRYIERMNRLAEQKAEYETVVVKKTPAESTGQKESSGADAIDAIKDHPIFTAVLKGSKGTILDEVKKALDAGVKPDAIINDYLIAAINEVGVLFDKKKYFLPQLIGSANTMKKAIDYLEPMLERREDAGQMPTLVIATVEGDIHDIGKNLVVLMLKNYGYNVIDMGKDVPCEDIVDTAIREDAAIIGPVSYTHLHMLSRSILQMGALQTIHKEEPLHGQLVAINDTLSQAMNNIRESVHDLHNESLDLKQALREVTDEFRDKYEIAFTYDMSAAVPRNVKY